jgi:hypothetical protein
MAIYDFWQKADILDLIWQIFVAIVVLWYARKARTEMRSENPSRPDTQN